MAIPKWLQNLRDAVLDSAVKYVLEAALGAVLVAVAAYHSLAAAAGPWAPLVPYLVGAAAVFVFGVILLSVNQYRQLQESTGRERAANRSPAEIERQVKDWLYKWKYQIRDDPQNDVNFQILATDAQGLKVTVLKLREIPWIHVLCKLTFSGDTLKKIIEAPGSTFRSDLTIELSQLGVDYSITSGAGELVIQVERKVVFDASVTELTFRRELSITSRALLVASALAGKAIGGQAGQFSPSG